MKNKKCGSIRFFSFCIMIFASIFLLKADRVEAGCYVNDQNFDKSEKVYFTIDPTPSVGKPKSIEIINQNPPSLLQTIFFGASDSICPKIFNFGEPAKVSFTTKSSTIEGKGWPFLVPLYGLDKSQVDFVDGSMYGLNGNTIQLFKVTIRVLSDIKFTTPLDRSKKEDAIIEEIKNTELLNVKIDNTQSHPNTSSSEMSAKLTNCAKISGNGPIKIIFRRS